MGMTGEHPKATIEIVEYRMAPPRWPIDWTLSGEAFGLAQWSARAYGAAELRDRCDRVRVLLRTQLGVFAGLVMVGDTETDLAGGEIVVNLAGYGPLAYCGVWPV
jgi:hypothetical protein